MQLLLRTILGWLLRKTGLFLLIVAALLAAPSIIELTSVLVNFDRASIENDIGSSVSGLSLKKGAAESELLLAVDRLRKRRNERSVEFDHLKADTCFLPTCDLVKGAKLYRMEVEMHVLGEALMYSGALLNGGRACERLQLEIRRLGELKRNEEELETKRPPWAPRSSEHESHRRVIKELEVQVVGMQRICRLYRELPEVFVPKAPSESRLSEFSKDAASKLGVAWKMVLGVLFSASFILAALIVAPIGVKLLSYYAVAPLASRRFRVELLPQTAGEIVLVGAPAALQRVEIDSERELLIDPSLLRSSPDSAIKETRLLLDWSMPMTSLLANLYLLTRIRSFEKCSVTLAAGSEQFDELAVLNVPDGSALVLQPRCLVGLIRSVGSRPRITKHWRAGSLGSWLTLQLRYVAFHGPVRLIVRGNRGIALEPTKAGTALNQAATLGFSANVAYGVTRCETFYSYFRGEQELFNDSFGAGGHCVHEVNPRPRAMSMLTGRGIEGALNTILKVFGI